MGNRVKKDKTTAYNWYVRAAYTHIKKIDSVVANEKLKYITKLRTGKIEFDADLDAPLKLFRKKAEEGNAEAQYLLALTIEEYINLQILNSMLALDEDDWPEDYEMPSIGEITRMFICKYVWLTLSANNGFSDATKKLQEVKTSYLTSDKEMKANIDLLLGERYEEGRAVPQNFDMAASLYQTAISLGDPRAIPKLGKVYERGLGVIQNYEKAISLYQQAIEIDEGWSIAQHHLGYMYERGIGVDPNFAKAHNQYLIAAKMDFDEGFVALWNLYMNGIGVPKDIKKAFMWLYASQDVSFTENNSNSLPSSALLETVRDFLSVEEIEVSKKDARAWIDACYYNDNCDER